MNNNTVTKSVAMIENFDRELSADMMLQNSFSAWFVVVDSRGFLPKEKRVVQSRNFRAVHVNTCSGTQHVMVVCDLKSDIDTFLKHEKTDMYLLLGNTRDGVLYTVDLQNGHPAFVGNTFVVYLIDMSGPEQFDGLIAAASDTSDIVLLDDSSTPDD